MMFENKYFPNDLEQNGLENSTRVVETKFSFVNYVKNNEESDVPAITAVRAWFDFQLTLI